MERKTELTGINPLPPLCVDLDGTFIHEDVCLLALREGILTYPFKTVLILLSFVCGKVIFKRLLAKYLPLPKHIHTYQPVVDYIDAHKKKGGKVYLATGAPILYAECIHDWFPGIFDGIFATKNQNLVGKNKGRFLKNHFGHFIYIGNSWKDRFVFMESIEIVCRTTCGRLVKWGRMQKKPTTFL